jgi:hypothetical protein
MSDDRDDRELPPYHPLPHTSGPPLPLEPLPHISPLPPLHQPLQNPFIRVSEVAAKLGVAPITENRGATIVAMGADGNNYDLWDIIVALLDKMEQKA